MLRILFATALAGLWLAPLAQATEGVRHTGVVVAVQSDHRAMTLEEMGPWTGPKRGLVRHSIALTPDTKVVMVKRAEQVPGAEWPGGFAETALAPADIEAGDYVTVTIESRKGGLAARAVEVLRPTPEPSGR